MQENARTVMWEGEKGKWTVKRRKMMKYRSRILWLEEVMNKA